MVGVGVAPVGAVAVQVKTAEVAVLLVTAVPGASWPAVPVATRLVGERAAHRPHSCIQRRCCSEVRNLDSQSHRNKKRIRFQHHHHRSRCPKKNGSRCGTAALVLGLGMAVEMAMVAVVGLATAAVVG